jgi:HK97 family phage prohead protease
VTNTATRQRKSFPLASFKALPLEGPGVFESIVSVFGNVDYDNERCQPGCFAKSLAKWQESGDPIPAIFSHQWDDLGAHIGVTLDAKELAPGDPALPEAIRHLGGLWTKTRLDVDDDTQPNYAPRVWKLLERRSLKEFSFAYEVLDSARAADGATDLLELDIFEQGPTLKGANGATQLLSRKSIEAFMSKAWLNLTGSAEELRAAAYDAAEDYAEENDLGNGGYYATYLEATFPDRVVVVIEGWSDPCGEGTYWEFDVAFADGEATVSNPRLVVITGTVGTKPVTDPDEAELEDVETTDEIDTEGFGVMSIEARRKARRARRLGKSTTDARPGSTVRATETTTTNRSARKANGEDRKTEPGTGEAARALLELDTFELS